VLFISFAPSYRSLLFSTLPVAHFSSWIELVMVVPFFQEIKLVLLQLSLKIEITAFSESLMEAHMFTYELK